MTEGMSNRDSTSRRDNTPFSSSERQTRLWGPPSLLLRGYR